MWDNVLQIYKGLLVSQQYVVEPLRERPAVLQSPHTTRTTRHTRHDGRPDDWGYAKNYLNALFNLRTTESGDQSAARLEEALAFFRQLQSDNPRLYAPGLFLFLLSILLLLLLLLLLY
jgi:hypothetical protein